MTSKYGNDCQIWKRDDDGKRKKIDANKRINTS